MTNRRTAIICIAAALVMTAHTPPASSADLPRVAPPPARAPVMVPRHTWYGSYIGIQGGYGWGGGATTYSGAAVPAGTPSEVAGDPRGFLGGITYGTNWQFDRLVLGTESDFSFSNIKHRETLGPLTGFTVSVTAEQRLEWFSTTRARAGVVLGENLLIFGTGGFASATVESSSNFNLVAPGACGAGTCPIGSRDKFRWGWSAGGGIEYAQGPWSVKVEYLHYDLGTLNYNVVDPTAPGGAFTASTKFTGDLVRGGINYRFNWTFWDLVFGGR